MKMYGIWCFEIFFEALWIIFAFLQNFKCVSRTTLPIFKEMVPKERPATTLSGCYFVLMFFGLFAFFGNYFAKSDLKELIKKNIL